MVEQGLGTGEEEKEEKNTPLYEPQEGISLQRYFVRLSRAEAVCESINMLK